MRYNQDTHFHFHFDGAINLHCGGTENHLVLDALNRIESKMSEVSDALDALVVRITEDVDHLVALVAEAAATHASDQATIDALNADATATADRIKSIDPDPSFPGVVTPPPVEPPVEPPVV